MPLPDTVDIAELTARLAFWRVKNVGPKLMAECLQRFGAIATVFAEKNSLAKPLADLLRQADWRGAEQDLVWLSQPMQHLLLLDAPAFPKSLAEIPAAPPFIFVRGCCECLQQPQLALVGSRNPTYYGIKAAQLFTQQLVEAGFIITSGLALGVDAVCHRSALAANGQTIGVLAVGLDKVYPKRHQALADAILTQQGALISEFGVGMQALPENFPRRNRLISGLSVGVFVIEATLKSGSLITARYALEQGREIFALPGSIFQSLSQGCHALIKQGAVCVTDFQDILEEFPQLCLKKAVSQNSDDQKLHNLSIAQNSLLKISDEIPQSFENLIEQLAWPPDKLQIILTQLILQGLMGKTDHGYVRL